MRSAHLSDLHFGSHVCRERLQSLAEDILDHRPDLLVVTGDVTDRGRISQFRWARDFLMSLSIPFICVPGNREICFSAVWEWMVPSLAMNRFRRFFGAPDKILYHHEESNTVFFGLNSIHSFPSWPGRISRETRLWLREQAALYPASTKVVFLHHPVIPVMRASSFWAHALSEAGELLNICSQLDIRLILQGHKHRSSVVEVRIPERNAKVVVSCCGAPLMSRWDSAYHLIDITAVSIVVRKREFGGGRFSDAGMYQFSFDGFSRR